LGESESEDEFTGVAVFIQKEMTQNLHLHNARIAPAAPDGSLDNGGADVPQRERDTMIHYANPDETTFVGATFTFRFGAYGATTVVVIQRPGHVEDALETAAECLAKVAPGLFSEPDYADQDGYEACNPNDDEVCEACTEAAEKDHTYTTSGWLLSWEWTVDECEGEPFQEPRFNRFDIAEAHSLYWQFWHHGINSVCYRNACRASRLINNPADSFDKLSANGQAIYRQLCLEDGR
jgi:hypothetical protein